MTTRPTPGEPDRPVPYTLTAKAHAALAEPPGRVDGPDAEQNLVSRTDGYLTPEGHYREARRLLWVIDGELQSDRPRTTGELAVIALAHAVTALAADVPGAGLAGAARGCRGSGQ